MKTFVLKLLLLIALAVGFSCLACDSGTDESAEIGDQSGDEYGAHYNTGTGTGTGTGIGTGTGTGTGGAACTSSLQCDDGNACTQDACGAAGTCVNTAISALCDDGNTCTINDQCSNGVCTGTTSPDCGGGATACASHAQCDDGNLCTYDTCDANGLCDNAMVSGYCDDSDPCTENDQCMNGACLGSVIDNCGTGNPTGCVSASQCVDGNDCTADICGANGVCENPPVSALCNDGDSCTSNDQCNNGNCIGTDIPNCGETGDCTSTCAQLQACGEYNGENCCQCDSSCVNFGDCCSDACSFCDICEGATEGGGTEGGNEGGNEGGDDDAMSGLPGSGASCVVQPPVTVNCPAGETCNVMGCSAAEPGVCVLVPETCAGFTGGVECGCNNKTYMNACERLKEWALKSHDGPCN